MPQHFNRMRSIAVKKLRNMGFLLTVYACSENMSNTLMSLQERRAIVVLKGDPGVTGNVTFIQYKDDGPVTVRGTISGLSKGMHGFHIHEKGDLTSGCKSTEGHFNPDKVRHCLNLQIYGLMYLCTTLVCINRSLKSPAVQVRKYGVSLISFKF